ncbi:MAG: heparinase II/III family protein, partial [Spirochaetia bacterium]|nr:heparinase II/III family protein [Spirochaetia bacterium]
LWKELQNAADFPDWDAPHFLGTAEMTYAFALAYDWLHAAWTPEERKILKTSIKEKGLEWGLKYYQNKMTDTFNWAKTGNNWNQVCNGAMGIGSLAIADEEPELAGAILKEGLARLPKAMADYGPDGAWFEGPMYLAYAMRYNAAFIASLESALGTDFGLSQIPGFQNTGRFITAMAGPSGAPFNFADAGLSVVLMPELFWLAAKFNQGDLAYYQETWTQKEFAEGRQRFAEAAGKTPLSLLWYKGKVDSFDAPFDFYFRNAEVASIRSSWSDPNALFVAFKAGETGESHGHLDLGTFVLEKNGVRWAADLGPDSYNLPGYNAGFKDKDSKRWRYYRTATEGQNTLVIKAGENANQNIGVKAKIDRFGSGSSFSFGIIDLSAAYTPNASSVKRGIAMWERRQVLIQDEIAAGSKVDIYWIMQTPASVELSGNKKTAILQKDGKECAVEILSPAEGSFEVWDAQPKLNEPLSEGNNKNEDKKRLVIHLKESATTLAVIFKDKGDQKSPKLQALSTWEKK